MKKITFGLLISGLMVASAGWLRGQNSYDLIIRGARLLDGTGNPWYYADIAINGDRIAAMGDLKAAQAKRVIEATGLYVAPGFIDVHSHAGPGLATAGLSPAQPLLAQGITTVFVNPDGGGPSDLALQKKELLRDGLGVNVALLIGQGAVRSGVMGAEDRAPSAAELEKMKDLVATGMAEGAFGLSSGLFYAPGNFARTEEVVELARVAARSGGVYTSHIRDEADYTVGVVAAVDEVIQVARSARLPGVVTHIKALGPRVWGASALLVKRIERARDEGVEVFADQYPYEASGTGLTAALVPRWAEAGGHQAMLDRFSDASLRDRLRTEMLDNLDRRGGASRLQFRFHPADPSIEGRTLQEVADKRGQAPIDTALDLIKEGSAGVVSFNMDEEDIERLMRQSWVMTSTDGDLVPMGEGVPHPRGYGTYARKLRLYVKERCVVDLPFAIRSMTSLPATVFRLQERGLLRVGNVADIVIFDLDKVMDKATYQRPHQLAEGMVYVLVNGQPAIDKGRFTDTRAGAILKNLP